MAEDIKEDKELRKKKKEERRKAREHYQKKLAAVDPKSYKQRNPVIIDIVRNHLKRDIDVFQARWHTGALLSNEVFLNTPLFWYKKHKWTHKDVREFFKIIGISKSNLDNELSVIWGVDDDSKKKKKEKRKKLKEKHLRRESFASLLTLRHSSLQLMQERSMSFAKQSDRNLDAASAKIWSILTKEREENTEEINHDQFNICLVDNKIQVDPDMSVDLFYEFIRFSESVDKLRMEKKKETVNKDAYKQAKRGHGVNSIAAIGGSAAMTMIQQQQQHIQDMQNVDAVVEDEDADTTAAKNKANEIPDPPQKEKIKHIKKKCITRRHIRRMLRHIQKNVRRGDKIANPKSLKKYKVLLVVFSKIFDALQDNHEFDVQNDYISQALSGQQLNDPLALLEILETRDAEWKQRLQCLEYIESNISANENLKPLFAADNFLLLIVGWTTQLYDERSRITQTAAELFPSLLTQCLSKMETPAIIFEPENECLKIMLDGLFTLLKNKRAKTLADIAHDVLIETINILSTVAQDLNEKAYHRMLDLLHRHTQPEFEKHDKVRAGCIAYTLFVIYGTESQERSAQILSGNTLSIAPMEISISVDSEHETEEKDKEKEPKKIVKVHKNVKMAKKPQRAFLFKDENFMITFAKIIGNGIEDKSKETRDKTMKVLKKIESEYAEIVEKYIDPLVLKKYEKWKRFNAPKGKKGGKKRQRISPIKRAKTAAPKKLLDKGARSSKSMANVKDNDPGDGALPLQNGT